MILEFVYNVVLTEKQINYDYNIVNNFLKVRLSRG